MKRRDFIQNNAKMLVATPFINFQLNSRIWDMNKELYKCKIGTFECTIFKDFMFKYKSKDYFINAGKIELEESLNKYKLLSDDIPSPYISMLLQDGDRKILIDSGIGFSEEPIIFRDKKFVLKGQLAHLLKRERVNSNEITDVIITHFHPDHIGGIFSSDNQLAFTNATFHLHQKEWDYWHSSKADNQPPLFKFFIKNNITPLEKENINFIKDDYQELSTDIIAVNAAGHTEGQIALMIGNKNDRLLYISDAFLHPLHIEKLDWQTNYDLDHKKAKNTRMKLLDLAFEENMRVNAFHFDFPGIGFVQKENNSWKWVYGK
jgi:glyoxylase-like metal-dependent hydrolase (beta-lactamase superfamily II)